MSTYEEVQGSAGERGSRRKKLAGYLKAANELRQSYRDAYASRGREAGADEDDAGIPGAFPEMVVARSGVEEMVLFPSYARRHSKKQKPRVAEHHPPGAVQDTRDSSASGDAEYWRREWEIYEDANAIVDVDVRGWIYSPHTGPMTRKNRLLFGIARHLSGLPAPSPSSQSSRGTSGHGERVAQREEEAVEKEVEQITNRGRREADVAGRGGYSEMPEDGLGTPTDQSRSPSPGYDEPRPGELPHTFTKTSLDSQDDESVGPGVIAKRSSWHQPTDMSPAQLAIANKHLMARLKPFLSNPAVNIPLTIFYYNDNTSQSRTTKTNESGHFNFRAALDFVPTHVKVLTDSNLSATEEVQITEPNGISLISDIDDTIKHSAISNGAREIFRNTFIRELEDLTIDGVKEWYTKMFDMGVKLHYVSNAPWQLYPVLVSFFARAGLPPGSFHLKQYTGMFQGIFEPVAERKKSTLDRIMRDFPERRFILVGDSGEADLELYTEIVVSNPGRILGVFIRDVTTVPGQGFFDPSLGRLSARGSTSSLRGGINSSGPTSSREVSKFEQQPPLPPRPNMDTSRTGPIMGQLIDFDEDPETKSPARSLTDPPNHTEQNQSAASFMTIPPERPSKPIALRSNSSGLGTSSDLQSTLPNRKGPPPPPKPRRLSEAQDTNHSLELSPLSQTQKIPAPNSRSSSPGHQTYRSAVKNKVASAYNAIPSPISYWSGGSNAQQQSSRPDIPRTMSIAHTSDGPPPIPPRRNLTTYPAAAAQYANNKLWSNDSNGDGYGNPVSPVNKKVEIWKRRLARAQHVLESKSVILRIWRVGEDVMQDAVRLVQRAEKEDRGEAPTKRTSRN